MSLIRVAHRRRYIQNPDQSYSNWHYTLGDCHACDIDWIETTANGEPVAIIETIKGLGKEITAYKKKVYENLSNLTGLPFYIVNHNLDRGLFAITDQGGATVLKDELQYMSWLRNLRKCRKYPDKFGNRGNIGI